MNKCKILFTLALTLIFVRLFSQANEHQIVPISPNAESIGLYSSSQINKYIGAPDIKIPLMSIDLHKKKIPITLSYQASGIKVNQEASWVGLGWTLSAGGCIVKEIRGADDFGGIDDMDSFNPQGYYSSVFPKRTADNHLDLEYYKNDLSVIDPIVAGEKDAEPDIYTFNFCGYSGKMIIEKEIYQTNILMPKAKLLVNNIYLCATFNILNNAWEIIDGDGIKYEFTTYETSEQYSGLCNNKLILSQLSTFPVPPSNYQRKVITSWYLDKITSPDGFEVKFTYDNDYIITQPNLSETSYYQVSDISLTENGQSVNIRYNDPSFMAKLPKYNPSPQYININITKSIIKQVYLKKINFPNGLVEFKVSGRKDIEPAFTNSIVHKLDSIIISNPTSIIKQYAFDYSYQDESYYANYTNNRLCLEGLNEKIENSKVNKYKFSYYNIDKLPSKISFAKDHWGYFNGKYPNPNNYFLLAPTIYYPININGKYEFSEFKGKDLYPDAELMKYGVLSEIKYPTGGKSKFYYSPHTFSTNTFYDNSVLQEDILNIEKDPNQNLVVKNFTLEEDTYCGMKLYFTCNNSETFSSMTIFKKDDMSTVISYLPANCDMTGTVSPVGNEVKYLSKGEYVAVLNVPNSNWDDNINGVVYRQKMRNITFGGGLKVDSIHECSKDLPVVKKSYNYNYDGYSSGALMIVPNYHCTIELRKKTEELETDRFGTTWVKNIVVSNGLYLTGHSSPTCSFSYSAMGSPVGYWSVDEEFTVKNDKWKTNTIFFNDVDDVDSSISNSFFSGFNSGYHYTNGNISSVHYYDKSGECIKEESYYYKKSQDGLIPSLAVYLNPGLSTTTVAFNDIKINSIFLDKVKTSEYINGSVVLNETNYTYNKTNKQINSIKAFNSNNECYEKKILFPDDFQEPVFVNMVKNSIVNPKIEEIKLKNNNIVEQEKINYNEWTPNLFSPISVYKTLGNGTPFQICNYSRYDNKGNVLEIKLNSNLEIVYLWSYSSQYPIAEIENATYDEVKAALGYTDAQIEALAASYTPNIDEIRQKLSTYFTNKKVPFTTYTYKPLVGMVTATDARGVTTTYDYDTFNRLKSIKDTNGKILQQFDYHYSQQQ